MRRGIARIGDTTYGYCSSHHNNYNGTITGPGMSGNITGNGVGIALDGCVVTSSCGHTGVIHSSSITVIGNLVGIARINDPFTGTYYGTITSGSTDILAGD